MHSQCEHCKSVHDHYLVRTPITVLVSKIKDQMQNVGLDIDAQGRTLSKVLIVQTPEEGHGSTYTAWLRMDNRCATWGDW